MILQLNNILSSPSALIHRNPSFSPHNSLSSPATSITTYFYSDCYRYYAAVHRCKKLSVLCRSFDYFEQQSSTSGPPNNSSFISHSPGRGGEDTVSSSRVYVGYTIYKGKAALTVDPKGPEFASLDSGAFKLSKEGFVLLQFAPSSGLRQYDWHKKLVFSLSATEIGSLIILGAKDSVEFFHDPNKGRSDEGKIRKVLKVEPLPDGSGHFFNLSVHSKILDVDESVYVPITRAEFAVIISGLNYILPYLIGWHGFANSMKLEDRYHRLNFNNSRPEAGIEWTR